jgi:hypothetical protein
LKLTVAPLIEHAELVVAASIENVTELPDAPLDAVTV